MSGIAIGTYIKLIDEAVATPTSTFRTSSRVRSVSITATPIPLAVSGLAVARSTFRRKHQRQLVFAISELALSVFRQAAEEFWLVRIRTVWLDPDSLIEGNTFNEELYAITGFEHDSE